MSAFLHSTLWPGAAVSRSASVSSRGSCFALGFDGALWPLLLTTCFTLKQAAPDVGKEFRSRKFASVGR